MKEDLKLAVEKLAARANVAPIAALALTGQILLGLVIKGLLTPDEAREIVNRALRTVPTELKALTEWDAQVEFINGAIECLNSFTEMIDGYEEGLKDRASP